MQKVKNNTVFIISILIPLAVGFFSSLFSKNMDIYSSINKPLWSPPAFLFPVVWISLYLVMGLSSYIIYTSRNSKASKALFLYGLQLFFNFFWSIIFSSSHFLLAFLWLVLLVTLIYDMIKQFYSINHIAAYLNIPYFLWCLFAGYLNFSIILLN